MKKIDFVSLLVPHSHLPHLVLKERLQLVGTLVVLGLGRVVHAAVGEDARHVGDEQTLRDVISEGAKESSKNEKISRICN